MSSSPSSSNKYPSRSGISQNIDSPSTGGSPPTSPVTARNLQRLDKQAETDTSTRAQKTETEGDEYNSEDETDVGKEEEAQDAVDKIVQARIHEITTELSKRYPREKIERALEKVINDERDEGSIGELEKSLSELDFQDKGRGGGRAESDDDTTALDAKTILTELTNEVVEDVKGGRQG